MIHTRTIQARALGTLTILALVFSACTAAAAAAPTSTAQAQATATAAPTPGKVSAIDRIKAAGALYVAIYSSAPLSYLDSGSNWVGAEADIVRQCASDKLGLAADKVFPIILPIAAMLPGLQSKRFDMVAGLSLNPARLQVALATTHLHTWGSIVVFRKGDPLVKTVHSWDDLAKNGETLGLAAGVTDIAVAQAKGVPTKTDGTTDLYVADLLAGRVRVILYGNLQLPTLITQTNGQLEAPSPWTYEGFSGDAMYFNQDDKDLRDLFNDCINTLKGNGKAVEILNKWNIALDIPPAGPPPN